MPAREHVVISSSKFTYINIPYLNPGDQSFYKCIYCKTKKTHVAGNNMAFQLCVSVCFLYRGSKNKEILWLLKCKSGNTENIKPTILSVNFLESQTLGLILHLLSSECSSQLLYNSMFLFIPNGDFLNVHFCLCNILVFLIFK